MKRRSGVGPGGMIATLLAGGALLVSAAASGQEREGTAPVDPDDRADYAELEEVIVRGRSDAWRLTDEDREKIWREVEGEPPPPSGAAAILGSGRLKAEIVPVYDPENPRVIDMGIDGQRTEAVELFRIRF